MWDMISEEIDKVSKETNRATREAWEARENSSKLWTSREAKKEEDRRGSERWMGEEEEIGSIKLLPTSHGGRWRSFKDGFSERERGALWFPGFRQISFSLDRIFVPFYKVMNIIERKEHTLVHGEYTSGLKINWSNKETKFPTLHIK
jgi:hypothetical protein